MEEDLIINTEVKNANKTEQQLDDIAEATNKANEASEDYEETLGDMAKETEIFGVSLNGLSEGFNNSVGAIARSVKSLGAFKTALIATGIGAIVVLLGSLVQWLKNSQEGMNFLNDATKALGVIMTGLLKLISDLGKALIKVFKGDFKGALNDAGDAMSGFVDQTRDAINATLKLEEQLRNLSLAQGRSNVLIAANNAEIAKNKRIIEDTTKSTRLRIKAAERSQELIVQNAKFQEDLAFQELEAERERIRIDNDQNGRTTTLIADQLILRDLEAQVIETQTESNEKQIEFEVKLNELRVLRMEELEQIRLIKESTGAETERATQKQITDEQTLLKMQIDGLAQLTKATDEAAEKKKLQREADLLLAQQNAEIEVQMAADLFGALAGLAGQDSELGKALAIAQAAINTQVAITKALTAPTMIQRILGVAFATATGLKAVQDIRGIPLPQVTIASTPFARGGMIEGDSHSMRSGGVHLLAEGGEAIINKRSVSMFKPLLSSINQAGGGVPIMASGGIVPDITNSRFINLERALEQSRPVLITSDLRAVESQEIGVKVATTL